MDTVGLVLSTTHEVVLDVFRHRPELVSRLLSDALGVDVPAHERVRLEPGDCTDLAPTEYRADAVVVLDGPGADGADRPVLAAVVEVQLRRDAEKRRSWPVYVATLHARLGCPPPPALLVVRFAEALAHLDPDRADLYAELVLAALPQDAHDHLEALMVVLDARGIAVPDDVRDRVTACTDLDQLDTWLRHAVTADKARDLFA